MVSVMNLAAYSKFDSQVACEEIADFVPSNDDLLASLPSNLN
jgi:hypothetical protein